MDLDSAARSFILHYMNVAILHFHLRRGGVGTVMHRQAECLAASGSGFAAAFIVGSAPDGPGPAPAFVVPGLDYDDFTGASPTDLEEGAAALADSIERAVSLAFSGRCDVIHAHNPLLRKNARLLGALRILQRKGYALLVQEHDFAEDFRPDVYDPAWPYPDSCDYATVNSRDRDNLVAAGLDPARVHLLPNPVRDPGDFKPRRAAASEIADGRPTALYPVRAIRRKNVGEALLLSGLLPARAELAITLPPTSPGDRGHYEGWKRLAERGWPVRFDAGMNAQLQDLYDLSFLVVTTSVKEGFGYSYLEPLVRGLPVVGREISHITRDFLDRGIRFTGLYGAIHVPAEAVDRSRLLESSKARLARMRQAFGPAFGEGGEERLESLLSSLDRRFEGELLDFGSLEERSQSSILERMRRDEGFSAELGRLNPGLAGIFERAHPEPEIRERREAALSRYSQEEYGRRLAAAYESAASRGTSGAIDKAALIERYLDPAAFFLIAS